MVKALDMTPDCMTPRMSSSWLYCGTMVIEMPAAAEVAKPSMAALSVSVIAGSALMAAMAEARGTGLMYCLPNPASCSVLVAHLMNSVAPSGFLAPDAAAKPHE